MNDNTAPLITFQAPGSRLSFYPGHIPAALQVQAVVFEGVTNVLGFVLEADQVRQLRDLCNERLGEQAPPAGAVYAAAFAAVFVQHVTDAAEVKVPLAIEAINELAADCHEMATYAEQLADEGRRERSEGDG